MWHVYTDPFWKRAQLSHRRKTDLKLTSLPVYNQFGAHQVKESKRWSVYIAWYDDLTFKALRLFPQMHYI